VERKEFSLNRSRGGSAMIRVYFVYEDPLDDAEVNLSFVDLPTQDPNRAFERVDEAARSGELWKMIYPDDQDHPYSLIGDKMAYIDISGLPHEWTTRTILAA
jgi:hypothetical protein